MGGSSRRRPRRCSGAAAPSGWAGRALAASPRPSARSSAQTQGDDVAPRGPRELRDERGREGPWSTDLPRLRRALAERRSTPGASRRRSSGRSHSIRRSRSTTRGSGSSVKWSSRGGQDALNRCGSSAANLPTGRRSPTRGCGSPGWAADAWRGRAGHRPSRGSSTKVTATVREHEDDGAGRPGARVVSGGPDSVCLLYSLWHLRRLLGSGSRSSTSTTGSAPEAALPTLRTSVGSPTDCGCRSISRSRPTSPVHGDVGGDVGDEPAMARRERGPTCGGGGDDGRGPHARRPSRDRAG